MNKHARRAPSVWRPVDLGRFLLGVAHYPEHVDRTYWKRDAERMAEAGVTVIRLGEFAWHIFEPVEGRYDFTLFDDAIAIFAQHGIETIMCTPTATPPRWLTYRHPEILRLDENGRPASHGSRQHCDPASPLFRLHSRRITRAMAEHYSGNPHVIGWQTDNELNTSTPVSFSEATLKEFQVFLQQHYGSIDMLNRAWGGDFWATAYQSFDEIVLPVPAAPVTPGPGHHLDYHRFLAFATARFQAEQVDILRAAGPEWFVFHNLGRLDDIDFRSRFSSDLDLLGYDVYPLLNDEVQRLGNLGRTQALALDLFRGFSGNFIVPEQQAGSGSQPLNATLTPEPGEMRRMGFSSIARGADGILFFRWRPAHFGAESFWMGIIDHDDVPRRRYDEMKGFFSDVAGIADKLLGTHVLMDVGICGGDFDNQEAHRSYPMGLPSPQDDAALLHGYCYRKGIACGFIHPDDDLSPLKLLYVPHWVIWKDGWTEKVEAFIRKGGTAVFGARTATRDADNHVITTTAPGNGISRLTGVTVTEFGRMAGPQAEGLFPLQGRYAVGGASAKQPSEATKRRIELTVGNNRITGGHLYERLSLGEDVDVVGRWSTRFLAEEPAITVRRVGAGHAVYVGTYLTEALLEPLCQRLFEMAGVAPLIADLPEGCEVSLREAADRRLLFLANTAAEPATIASVPAGEVLILDGSRDGSNVKLGAYGVAVILLAA